VILFPHLVVLTPKRFFSWYWGNYLLTLFNLFNPLSTKISESQFFVCVNSNFNVISDDWLNPFRPGFCGLCHWFIDYIDCILGEEKKCPDGESSSTGFTPCSSKSISLTFHDLTFLWLVLFVVLRLYFNKTALSARTGRIGSARALLVRLVRALKAVLLVLSLERDRETEILYFQNVQFSFKNRGIERVKEKLYWYTSANVHAT